MQSETGRRGFNPRVREGRDQRRLRNPRRGNVSIHASARDATASAASDWEWIANRNPDVPADELTKIVTEAYRENSYPRGKLNVDYGTWHDLLNSGQMALYPDVRPDTLYILSAQNNSLGLWKVL